MPTIPKPSELVALAKSASRPIEDQQWKQYQRYLAKYKEINGDPPDEPPISFEKFCDWLNMNDQQPPNPKKHP